ncbi:hypothetical protein [Acinetobacter nosocomialis]|uniref:hypothetical protein n=1 Tax=Acinetobacter nosocomialis TaxID=106654 RepID=UPI00148F4177|nr:hypothetical protein [Acinetobacter nosocomialis]
MNREQAIQLLKTEIEVFKKNPDDYQRGYLCGLLNAFSRLGFISDDLNDQFFDLIADIG